MARLVGSHLETVYVLFVAYSMSVKESDLETYCTIRKLFYDSLNHFNLQGGKGSGIQSSINYLLYLQRQELLTVLFS